MHYSAHRTLSLDAETLYHKIVERGLGGYCMESNLFFATVLRSLGYQLYVTGGRISNGVEMNGKHPDGFGGWEHMIILLTHNQTKYLVDVGCGSQGPLSPIPLTPGFTVACVPGNSGRLTHGPIAALSDQAQSLWLFSTCNVNDNVWRLGYCFSELEFLPDDFVSLNYRINVDPKSWFTYRLVMTRVLLDERLREAVETATLMGGNVSMRVGGGNSEVVVECKTEGERVEALERWFGVKLREEEKRGIVGLARRLGRRWGLFEGV